MERKRLAMAFLGALAASVATGTAAEANAGYRDNLVSCIRGMRGCQESALSKADAEYLESDRTARTRDPRMAGKIADARMQKPVRIVVSEERLDHMHARTVKFETYRSQVRALQHGWLPGVNQPYQQPPEGWAVQPRRRHIRNGVAGSPPPLAPVAPFLGAAGPADPSVLAPPLADLGLPPGHAY